MREKLRVFSLYGLKKAQQKRVAALFQFRERFPKSPFGERTLHKDVFSLHGGLLSVFSILQSDYRTKPPDWLGSMNLRILSAENTRNSQESRVFRPQKTKRRQNEFKSMRYLRRGKSPTRGKITELTMTAPRNDPTKSRPYPMP